MSERSREIDDIEVEVTPRPAYPGSSGRGSIYLSFDDNRNNDSEVYGSFHVECREEADWLIARLTSSRDIIWPTETDPDAPNQLALIPSLVSAGRDDELVMLRQFAQRTRSREDDERSYVRILQEAADRLARAAELTIERMPDHEAVDLLAWAVTRYGAVSNVREIERLESEFKADLAKLKQEGTSENAA